MGDLLRSEELRRLTVGPAAAGMAAPLQELQQFTDWEQAAELGRIVPHRGADRAFDDADARVRSAPCMREEPYFTFSHNLTAQVPVYQGTQTS